MVGEAGLIRSRWTRADYGELILHLLQADLTIIDSDKFTSDAPGIWLRHDVELCLQSAVEMAQLENDLEVPSTYFVCMESPFFDAIRSRLGGFLERLLDLGREVSFHLVLSASSASVERRLQDYVDSIDGLPVPSLITYHAPGVPSEALAQAPHGHGVYAPLAGGTCKYFSDSTGRWRWGDPRFAGLAPTDTVQLLTHPFWWAGTYVPVSLSVGEASGFLPQLTDLTMSAHMDSKILPVPGSDWLS